VNWPTEHLEADFFEVICYMVTSAANLTRETKAYGPFRLVDAVSRLINVLEKNGVQSTRLGTIRAKIEEMKYSVMTDEEQFNQALQGLVVDLVPLMDMLPFSQASHGSEPAWKAAED
jgi:hypothetical protein